MQDNNKHSDADFETIEKEETDDARKIATGKNMDKESKDKEVGTGEDFLTEDERRVVESASNDITGLQAGQGPLDRKVIERSYTEREYSGDTLTPIREPQSPKQVITETAPGINIPPKAEQNKNTAEGIYKDKQYATEGLGEKDVPRTGGNPAVQNMSSKERSQNLEMTVDMAISSYASVKEWIGGWLTISDSTLIKRQNTGKTPPDWAVLYDSVTQEVMTMREFIHEGNKRIEQACKTDDEFKRQIRPLLMAEFDRRNLIASPQQNIFFYLGKDLFSMGQKLVAVHMNMRKVMIQVDKEFAERKKSGYLSARDIYNMNRNYMPQQPQAQVQQVTTPVTPVTPEAKVQVPETNKTETITLPADEPAFEPPTD